MNEILEYYTLVNHILDGKPVKQNLESGYIPKKRVPLIKIEDSQVTEITLSQSLIKGIFWSGPATQYVGAWDLREDACGWKFYNLNISHKYSYPTSASMTMGNYFETLCLGGGAYSKTLSIPKNQRNGNDTAIESRILEAVDRFRRMVKETGIIIGHGNTQVERNTPIIDDKYPDIKVHMKMIADLISPFFYENINFDTAVLDLKLTSDRDSDFFKPKEPWNSYCWGSPDRMSVLQGTSYGEGFDLPFVNLVFDYKKDGAGWKPVPVRTLVTHPDDNEAKLRSMEMKQGIRSTIQQIVDWNEAGWPKMKNYTCPKCPVSDCPIKNEIEFY
jgi:hypothetical protein